MAKTRKINRNLKKYRRKNRINNFSKKSRRISRKNKRRIRPIKTVRFRGRGRSGRSMRGGPAAAEKQGLKFENWRLGAGWEDGAWMVAANERLNERLLQNTSGPGEVFKKKIINI